MTTTPMAPAHRSAFVAVALQALGIHAAHHHLPAPHTITVSDHDQPLQVTVYLGADRATQEWWLATVNRDATREEWHPSHSTFEWDVRLPDTGTRITLRGSRPATPTRVRPLAVIR